MERRKLLIGSGAALVTALAGCAGSDGDDDADDTESADDSGEDHSDDGSSDDGSDDEESSDDEMYDDVPGLDAEDLSIDSDTVKVDRVAHDDGVVSVDATTETTDPEELYDELDTLGTDLSEPTTDIDELKESVEVIEWTVGTDDETVVSFDVEPIWIYNYMNESMTEEEFLDEVLETVV